MARAAEQAYRVIREGILEGRYAPGERLPEESLAAEIGVSRTPVREALRRLHGDGFVEFVPNHGAHVVAWTAKELDEMFELRAMLEGYGASLAAKQVRADHLQRLGELAGQMQAINTAERSHLDLIGELNNEFHDLVLEAAANKRLAALVSQVKLVPLTHRTFHLYTPEQLRRSLAHHEELVVALQQEDSAWAQSVMHAHVLGARSVVLARASDVTVEPLRVVGDSRR